MSLSQKIATQTSGRQARKVALQPVLCFVLSAAIHAAATYSVSQSLLDTFKVFAGFSMQIVGIVLQRQARSMLTSRNGLKRSEMVQMAGGIAEAVVGVVWILFFFPSIFADPSLESVIKSIDRHIFFENEAG